jgi:hypothetical protein
MADETTNSNSQTIIDTNSSLIIESNKPIKHVDLDILSIYFENRKKSDGGDLISFNPIDDSSLNKVIKLVYQDAETKKRVLDRKFFTFGGYFLRSSESGYQNHDLYDLDKKVLIINNIDDLGLESNNDDSVVKIYAEYLLPDNDVVKLTKSNIFKDTYFIEYSNDINKETLMAKYNKKSKLRNRDIHIFDSFITNSLIVQADKFTNLSQLIQLALSKLFDKVKRYFFDELSSNLFLIQFESKISKEMLESLYSELISLKIGKNLSVEEAFNFKLINELTNVNSNHQINRMEKKIKQINLSNYVDKSVQTDVTQASTSISISNNQSNKTSSNPSSNRQIHPANNKNGFVKDINSNNLDDYLVLESDKYYTIGLLNSKQLLINFTDLLDRKYKNIELITQKDTISLRNKDKIPSTDWKLGLQNEINNFFTTKASYQKIQVPKDILESESMKKLLVDNLNEYNRACSAVYFKLSQGLIHSYGTINMLKKKIDSIPRLFKLIGSKSIVDANRNGTRENETSSISPINTNTSKQIKSNSLLELSLLNCKQIFSDFKSNLKNLNSDLSQSNGKFYIINIDQENRAKIESNMAEFEKNNLKQKEIIIPIILRRQKEITDLEKHLSRLFAADRSVKYKIVDQDRVTVYGYAKQVDRVNHEIRSKFSNLENNQKDRIKTKLNIKLADKKKNFQSVVFKIFNGVYLKELADILPKHNAKLEKINEASGYRVVCTITDQKRLTNETYVQNWRSNMDSLINNYFSKFETIRIQTDKNLFDSSGISSDLVDLYWLDNNQCDITGLKSEIKKILSAIPNASINNSNSIINDQLAKPIKATTKEEMVKLPKSNSKPVNGDATSKKETFIINDLKWFQTRILFEKKYFQYVSETFKDLVVLLDTDLTKMFFTGCMKDIDLAKKLAFDILDLIIGAQIECSEAELSKMSQNENECINLIKKNNLCCVLDLKSDKDRYTIYGISMEQIEKCKDLMSEMKF